MGIKKSGYTLIEILVAIAVLGIVAVIGSQMFFSILKNTTKSRVLAEVKQNGSHALLVMSRMIRNAKGIQKNSDDQTCESGMKKLRIENPNSDWTEFDFSGTRIASVSALRTDYLMNDKVAIDTTQPFQFDCVQTGDHPSVVTISFTLIQKTGSKVEEKVQIDFNTMVSLRTY
jgi:prepilin-type N-terminal cleavage/methylation domain-containing protein